MAPGHRNVPLRAFRKQAVLGCRRRVGKVGFQSTCLPAKLARTQIKSGALPPQTRPRKPDARFTSASRNRRICGAAKVAVAARIVDGVAHPEVWRDHGNRPHEEFRCFSASMNASDWCGTAKLGGPRVSPEQRLGLAARVVTPWARNRNKSCGHPWGFAQELFRNIIASTRQLVVIPLLHHVVDAVGRHDSLYQCAGIWVWIVWIGAAVGHQAVQARPDGCRPIARRSDMFRRSALRSAPLDLTY